MVYLIEILYILFNLFRRIQNDPGEEHNMRLRCGMQTVDWTEINCVLVQSGGCGIDIEQSCVHR